MRRVSLLVASLAVLAVVSGASSSPRSVESRWVLRDLGVSGTPVALNDRGQIVVHAAASDKAFLWESGRVIGLGTLGGKTTTAWSMNERGRVVGQSQTASGAGRAFLWQNGRMRNLGGGSVYAYRINERGQIIGNRAVNGAEHAFVWRNGTTTDLGTLGGKQSDAVAINERGQVVGWSATKRNDQLGRPVKHAFLWQAGKMIDLNPPGPFRSRAVAINVSGQVLIQTFRESGCLDYDTCAYEDPTPTDERAWLWAGGKFTKLGTVGGSATAVALNDKGQAIGRSGDHGFLWQNGTMTDLGTLPKRPSAAYWPKDINNQGQVVGSVFGENNENWRSWVWENGRMTDLATLGGGYAQVTDINERSQIVGQSRTKAAMYHAVLWTLRSG
jgi:probable HAF family extracellular repeat protein